MPQVIVLAGPSGAGKSRLADHLGVPVLRLDHFYKDEDDPTLPHYQSGPNQGLIDWDHPDSWNAGDALRTLIELCEVGSADVPIYDIATSQRTGHHLLDLGDSEFVVAEGIFAHTIVADCRSAGILAAAVCVTQRPAVTFWRRLIRDLREHRKPAPLLLRRGWSLMRAQGEIVTRAQAHGCTVMTPHDAYEALQRLINA